MRASGLARRVDATILTTTRVMAAGAALSIAAILALVLAAVVMRYVVSAPFRFTEELAGLLLAASVFLALPYTIAAQESIRVGLVSDRLGGWPRRVAWLAGQAVLMAFAAVFVLEASKITAFTLRLGLKSEQARLDLGPWLVLMTAGAAACGLVALWQALRPPPESG